MHDWLLFLEVIYYLSCVDTMHLVDPEIVCVARYTPFSLIRRVTQEGLQHSVQCSRNFTGIVQRHMTISINMFVFYPLLNLF